MNATLPNLERIRIRAEARQAAARYGDLNAACPYPWGTAEAIEFKRSFEAAREQQLDAIAHSAHHAAEPSSCACNAQHGIEELEWKKCAACGLPINP